MIFINQVNTEQLKIIVSDENVVMQEALKIYLESELGYEVITTGYDENELLQIQKKHFADIILMDISMPLLINFNVVKTILFHMNWVKIIAISGYYDKTYLFDLISAGFKGCVFKDSIFNTLSDAIGIVKAGGYYFPGKIKKDEYSLNLNI